MDVEVMHGGVGTQLGLGITQIWVRRTSRFSSFSRAAKRRTQTVRIEFHAGYVG